MKRIGAVHTPAVAVALAAGVGARAQVSEAATASLFGARRGLSLAGAPGSGPARPAPVPSPDALESRERDTREDAPALSAPVDAAANAAVAAQLQRQNAIDQGTGGAGSKKNPYAVEAGEWSDQYKPEEFRFKAGRTDWAQPPPNARPG